MRINKFVNWNTLKNDSWIGLRFNFLPSLSVNYQKNGIFGEVYAKEIYFSFDFLCLSANVIIYWAVHEEII